MGGADAVNPLHRGTKAAAHHVLKVPPGGTSTLRLRLGRPLHEKPFGDFDAVFSDRRREADAYYAQLQAGISDPDARQVQRQALAGLIWSKQFYYYDVPQWLKGDPAQPTPPQARLEGRNSDWTHLNNADVISMPDKWEYPWYATWDLAFHCIAMALVDPHFAKAQLVLLTREWYMHPNGQLPAYEWAFGDVNPPVQAWATWRVFQIDRKQRGDAGDLEFLERMLHKLLMNFTWWVNRKDMHGRNVFQGGFLGPGQYRRVRPQPAAAQRRLPDPGRRDQLDGDVLAEPDAHLARTGAAQPRVRGHRHQVSRTLPARLPVRSTTWATTARGLWDPGDEFYYDKVHLPDGRSIAMQIRSIVGLIPLFAVETLEPELLAKVPDFNRRLKWFLSIGPSWPTWSHVGTSRDAANGGCFRCCVGIA